jgi:hypothetical protein
MDSTLDRTARAARGTITTEMAKMHHHLAALCTVT